MRRLKLILEVLWTFALMAGLALALLLTLDANRGIFRAPALDVEPQCITRIDAKGNILQQPGEECRLGDTK